MVSVSLGVALAVWVAVGVAVLVAVRVGVKVEQAGPRQATSVTIALSVHKRM